MSEKLAPLTSLRFIAAIMIVCHHGHAEFKTMGAAVAGLPLNGGVSFFFVLSGFILAYAHPQVPTLSSACDFWIKRFARIWPVHIATLLFLLLVVGSRTAGGTIQSAGALASNILLLQTWFNDLRYIFSYNSVSWSISAEVFFYLMFPVLIYRIDQTWPTKLALCAVMVVLACIIYQQIATTLPASKTSSSLLIQFSPFSRLLEFMTGITALVLWRKYLQNVSLSRSAWTIIEVVVLTAAVAIWMQSNHLPVHIFGDFGYGWWYQAGIFIVPATLIIGLMATSQGALANFLSKRPLVFLGEISFSLYMIHQLVLRWYEGDRSAFDGYSNDAVMIWYVGASLVAAIALWALVEQPCRRVLLAAYRKATTSPKAPMTPSTSGQSA